MVSILKYQFSGIELESLMRTYQGVTYLPVGRCHFCRSALYEYGYMEGSWKNVPTEVDDDGVIVPVDCCESCYRHWGHTV